MANILNLDKQIMVIGALAEGSSIRSIERMTGVHRDTIMRLGVKVGQGCTAPMDAKMRDLPCTRVESDEIWGFVGKKERRVRPGDDPQFGNVWTFCAIDAKTKLVPAFKVGDRDEATAKECWRSAGGFGMNKEIPEILDWVSERARCTPSVVFETLRNQVEGDIQVRNLIGPQHGFPKRNFVLKGEGNWFGVLQSRFPEGDKGVFFMLTSTGVTVRDVESRRELYTSVLTLSDDGKCRLKVGDSEYNLWQFRKLALHDLFFVDQEIFL